jgi:diguanylate cyclase (GGDEF)-like protein
MPNDAPRRARLQRRDGRRRRRVKEGRLTPSPDALGHMEPLATNVLYIGADASTAVLRAALELVSRSGDARFALTHAPVDSADGLERLAAGGVDVVIVDAAASPEGAMDALVRSRIEAPDVPVVVLGAGDENGAGAAALQAGAQDWVARDPLDGPLLARVLRYAIERERLQSTLRQLALTDPLTGLYNRRGFLTLADHHLRLAPRTRGVLLASADVPALKQINETHGRDEGDRSLLGAAEVLRDTFRASDVVARLGADDFAVLVLDAAEETEDVIGPRLRAHMKRHRENHPEARVPLSLSLGIARYDSAAPPIAADLLARAASARAPA